MDTNFEKSDILKAKKSTFKKSHHMENTRYYFFTKKKRQISIFSTQILPKKSGFVLLQKLSHMD